MDLETGYYGSGWSKDIHRNSYRAVLTLAYQSFGIVYGDMSTSPLYVYQSTFSGKLRLHENDDVILGVLSLIFWTFTLIPLFKYVFVVLNADDNGEGGTFALYSLLCRHANLCLLPSQQSADEKVSTYKLEKRIQTPKCFAIKALFEKHKSLQIALLMVVLLGTCMVIGEGVLTPTISVLSAVSGIKVAVTHLNEHVVVVITCIILVGLFTLQQYGTHKVAFMFAPIVISWLLSIGAIGVYNVIHWNPSVFRALSPYYIYYFFKNTGVEGWLSLGGIILSITGSEAMFADLGHFSQLSIKIAFTGAVYPCLILAYMGQAAFLSKNHDDIHQSFYKSIPDAVYWPVLVVATLASVVASQAVISATFSIIKQSLALKCFPHVKVIHTSYDIYGQIYIPEINWMLMILCLAVTVGFRDTNLIGNAYGLAVAAVMFVTTLLMFLVMIIVWRKSIIFALSFLIFFGLFEGLYFLASLVKVPKGGWVSLVLAFIFMAIMCAWHYGSSKKYEFDLQNKVSMKRILSLGPSLGIVRVPGIGLVYTELVTGVPSIFSHFVTNIPAFHRVLVFVCIKSVPVPYVPQEERYLIGRIGPKEYRMFRCIIRYGYKDIHSDDNDFETQLVMSIGEFIQREGEESSPSSSEEGCSDSKMAVIGTPLHSVVKLSVAEQQENGCGSSTPSPGSHQDSEGIESPEPPKKKKNKSKLDFYRSPDLDPAVREELRELIEAKEAGITYVLGHSYVKAKRTSSMMKKFTLDVAYSFLKQNCRAPAIALSVPHICLIEVGMIYYV